MKLIIRFRDSVNSKEDIWMHGNVANRWFPRQNKLCNCQRPVNLAQTALVIASHHRERKVQPFDNSKDLLEVLLSTRKISIFRYFMFANLSDASALWYSLGWLSRYRIDLKYSKNEDIARVTVFSNICNLIFAVFFWERWLFRLDLETSRTNFKALYGVGVLHRRSELSNNPFDLFNLVSPWPCGSQWSTSLSFNSRRRWWSSVTHSSKPAERSRWWRSPWTYVVRGFSSMFIYCNRTA